MITCKNSFPYCGPTRPPGAMILRNLLLYYIVELSCKFPLLGPMVPEKTNFKYFFLYKHI
jgi:hypothetical protein